MTIRYIEPLRRAIERSIQICFRPFDLGKWFVLGFACWLARLTRGGGGGGTTGWDIPIGDREAEGAAAVPGWIESIEPGALFGGVALLFVIGCVAIFLLVVLPLLLWISSRGEFMFLDNVVHDRAEIKAPWHEYRAEGNSLFLWRLGFIAVLLVGFALAAAPLVLYLVRFGEEIPSIPVVLLLLCPILLCVVGVIYVDLFLRSFVVPVMYQERVKTNEAWRRFAPVLKASLGSFLVYGLWLLVLMIGLGFAVVILVLVTCCIAGILLILPYIGTVLLLPVYVALRALSLEFLAQFGDQFRIFPDPQPALATASAGPAEPPPPPPPASPSGTFEPEV